jgi:hypothetical protein
MIVATAVPWASFDYMRLWDDDFNKESERLTRPPDKAIARSAFEIVTNHRECYEWFNMTFGSGWRI